MSPLRAARRLLCAAAALAAALPAWAGSYAFRSDSYAWESTSSTLGWAGSCTGFPSDDDQATITFTGGFTFPFAGVSYSSVRVLTNGMLQFGTDTGAMRLYTNTPLPTGAPDPYGSCAASTTARTLMPYWTDLDPSSSRGASVTWQQKGTSPNRYVVISWNSVYEYRTSTPYTFQTLLYESGDIKYQYGNANTTGWNATIGVQVSDADFTQYVVDRAVNRSGTALRVYPELVLPLYLRDSGFPSSTMNVWSPTASSLTNYDSSRDSLAGLVVKRGGSNAAESDTTRYQRWLTTTGGIALTGTVELRVWTAMKDFRTDKGGSLNAYLRDCDSTGASCTSIGSATLTAAAWSGGSSTWVQKTLSFGTLNYTVAQGRTLELKLIVPNSSDDDMLLAYDTTGYPSQLVLGATTCGALGSAVDYPLYGFTNLNIGGGTVTNGVDTFTISGSGKAVNADSGVRLTPSPAPTLPLLSPASFPSNASSTDSSAATLAAGSYRTVTVGSTTTVAAGTTSIQTLTVAAGATLRLGAGTYNIGTLVLGTNASLVAPSGGVRLNIGSSFTANAGAAINASGTATGLQVFFYTNANASVGDNVRLTGLVYGRETSSNLSFGTGLQLTGAVVANNINVGSGAVITYTAAVEAALRATNTCDGPPAAAVAVDHYELHLPSTAVSCLPLTVTVKACADASSPCTNLATTVSGQTATLAAGAGTLAATSVTFDSTGVATTTWTNSGAANGSSASVTLSAEQTAAANARQCCPNGTACSAANSCSATFSTAGFIVAASTGGAATTVPAQVAGTTSGSFVLRAVKTGTTTQACEAGLTGATTVDWAVQCQDPTTCSSGNRLTLTGSSASAVASNPASGITTRTAVPMSFDANGNAPFSFNYADVGQILLSASKTLNGATLTGSTNAFVVKPASFSVTTIRQTASPNTANPAAASASGGVFVKAGEAFSATVSALTSSGATAPNFGREASPEGVLLTPTLVLPAGGTNGTLANATIAGGSFSAGVATATTLAYSEVGVITLTPSVADGSYLGAGAVSGTTTGNVGRFVPARFALSGTSVAHRSTLACTPASAFTYLGETFRLGLTLTAQNSSGATTVNYTGSFAKLDPTSASGWQLVGRDGATVFSTASGRLSLGTATGSFSGGVAANVTLSAAALRASAADGPFSAAFGVAPADSDGVTLASFDMAAAAGGANDRAGIGTVALRFGRLRLGSAIGAADRALALPAWVQHWTGSAWDTNTLDSCTTVAASAVSFGNLRRTLTTADTAAGGPITFAAGQGSLRLSAPGGGRSGTVDVALSLGTGAADASCLQPWTPGSGDAASAGANLAHLRGAWCGSSFVNDPSARASFGLQRTQDHVIYRRENY